VSSYVSCSPDEPSFITVYSPSSHRISVAAPNPTAIDHAGRLPRLVRCNASANAETRISQLRKWDDEDVDRVRVRLRAAAQLPDDGHDQRRQG